VIAYRITRLALPRGGTLSYAGPGHRVTVDGDDLVARCGARWPRKDDGGVRTDAERGDLCSACEDTPC
jgi:hypothetical protein